MQTENLIQVFEDGAVRGCLKSQNKCVREAACLWHDRPLGALRGLAKARALRSRHLRTAIAIEKEPRSKEKLSSRSAVHSNKGQTTRVK
ncbi:MAG: hypothetical protein F6K37_31685 [Moorea sp. SIO4E2]|uniref:hypothetical protein n=1 Tax=Moorena sp. SIO4E2 TaxID=2607826 RepID=UPI0013BB58C2|nr:hypothetical protein [Moorena sp. SIO4E2]NEQ10335.1 hypothetical protein [Moorena sp. SIO4E2]